MFRKALSSTLLIFLNASILLAVSSCGDTGGPIESDPPPAGSITISVRAAESGVSGVTVSFQGLSSGSATTDGSGNAAFHSLAPGTYTVSISNYPSDHYFPATSSSASVPPGGSTSVSFEGSRVVIRTESLPEAFVGKEYSAQLEADGGSGSYSWSLASGSLPEGLALSSQGEISGTPTTAESTSFTFRVGSGGAETSRDLTFEVSLGGGLILGMAYYDRDHDGMPSAGEGLPDLSLAFLPDDTSEAGDTVQTGLDGTYSVILAPGRYTITPLSLPDSVRAQTTPIVQAVREDTVTVHVGFVVVQEVGDLSLPISTLVLDSASAGAIHTSDGGSTITVPTTISEVGSLLPGDILVAGVTEATPQGLLRRVESVSTAGGQTTLVTVQATLEEAISEGSFAVRKTLSPEDLVAFQAPEGVSFIGGELTSEFVVEIDHVLFDEDGNHQTENDQIRLDGEIRFVPTVILESEFSWGRLKSATAGMELDLESGVELTWTHQADKSLEIQVAEFFFAAVPFGPFVFFPSIDVRVGVEGGVEATLNASLEYSASTLAAVELRDGAWNGISSWDDEVSGGLSASLNASASAYVRVPLRFELYSLAGPHAGVKTYVQGIVNPLANPWWELFFGVTGQAGIAMTVFSLFEAEVNFDLFDYRKTILDAGGPFNIPPIAQFDFDCTNLTCSFTDRSTDADGTIQGWHWDFGDGSTSNDQDPSHSYGAEGTYAVALVVTDNWGATDNVTRSVTVSRLNHPPTAQFAVTCNNLTCNFTDQSADSDGTIQAWSWSFGDGLTSTSRNPSHTYASAGTYSVTLTVTDNGGASDSATQSLLVADVGSSLFRWSAEGVPRSQASTATCVALFGNGYRMADWNDMRVRFEAGDNPDSILPDPPKHAWVTRNGVFQQSSSRYYFAGREPVHSGFLKHDTISNVFALGSWDSNYHLLCYRGG